jgi:hypothetical protein
MTRARRAITAAIGAGVLVLGVVGMAPATDVGAWSSPTTLSATGADVDAPQVVVSSDGTRAAAIWQRGAYGSRVVQTAFATITGNTAVWSSPGDLATGGDNIYPRIAMSADGSRATALWSHKEGSTWEVRSASATLSGNTPAWGAPMTLSAPGVSCAGGDVALSAAATRATAVWLRESGNITQSASGTIAGTTATWGTAVNLSNQGSSAGFYDAQVALSSDGTQATAVWAEGAAPGRLQSASAEVTGTDAVWSGPVILQSTQYPSDPAVALSADGTRAVAAWRGWSGSAWQVQSAAASISGFEPTWGSRVPLAAPGYRPRLTLSADGATATAVWQGAEDPVLVVNSATATVAGTSLTWGAATRLSDAGVFGLSPQVAGSADGRRVTAVWVQTDGSNNRVRANSARISGTSAEWGPASTLSAAGQDAGGPQVALADSGRLATAVWYRSDGSNGLLQASSALVRQTQTIDFPAIGDVPLTGGPVVLTASASSGLPVSYTSATPQVCTVSGDRAALVATGTCTIDADQMGNEDYLPAATASRSFTITASALKAQVPKKRCHIPPRKIRRSGKTVLMRKPCRTNAGQKVTVKVTSKPRVKKSGAYKVLRQKKAVKMRTFGKAFKVRVTWQARAKAGYSAYRLVRPYRVR